MSCVFKVNLEALNQLLHMVATQSFLTLKSLNGPNVKSCASDLLARTSDHLAEYAVDVILK